MKYIWRMSSAKLRSFCLAINVLKAFNYCPRKVIIPTWDTSYEPKATTECTLFRTFRVFVHAWRRIMWANPSGKVPYDMICNFPQVFDQEVDEGTGGSYGRLLQRHYSHAAYLRGSGLPPYQVSYLSTNSVTVCIHTHTYIYIYIYSHMIYKWIWHSKTHRYESHTCKGK